MTYPLLADPLEGGWTALQSWDPRRGRGALLAFRQQDERQTVEIALRNVPRGQRFELLARDRRGAARHGRLPRSCARA